MKRLAAVVAVALMSTGVAWGQQASVDALYINTAKGMDVTEYTGLCHKLKGRIVDHTSNHGKDNRIWSRAMYQWRDLYIYLPPQYDPNKRYPIMLLLHPYSTDERGLLHLLPMIDDAIVQGRMPPLIVALPDGSLDGKGCFDKPGSFFLNSRSGDYEDFILQDVWDFVCTRYPIRPERGAHVLAGVSMGGYAAFNIGLRYRQFFGVVMGIHPPLNPRWADVDGNPRAKFDPRRWGWRTGFDNPHEVIANFGGPFKYRMGDVIRPVFGIGEEAFVNISCNNPLELVINTKLRNGELAMFVGYAGRDEFNIDAQVESFLYYCKFKGLGVAVAFEPDGRHDKHTASKMMPAALDWLGNQIAPYGIAYTGKPPFQTRYPDTGTPEPYDVRYPAPGDMKPKAPRPVTTPSQYPMPNPAPPPPPPVDVRYPLPGVDRVPAGPLRYPGVGY
mgnify:CR=1 FL=1